MIYLKYWKGKTETKNILLRKALIHIQQKKKKIKRFLDKQKLREFSTNKPALQLMLKELL